MSRGGGCVTSRNYLFTDSRFTSRRRILPTDPFLSFHSAIRLSLGRSSNLGIQFSNFGAGGYRFEEGFETITWRFNGVEQREGLAREIPRRRIHFIVSSSKFDLVIR